MSNVPYPPRCSLQNGELARRGGRPTLVRSRTLLLGLTLALVAGACGDDDGGKGAVTDNAGTGAGTVTTVPGPSDTPETPETSRPSFTAAPLTPDTGPAASSPTSPSAGADSPEVQAAVADLARRLGVDAAEIEVLEVREVNWPDGSLGCPEPGVNYIQQILNGQLVVFGVAGQRYEYHSGPNRPLFYCPDPRPPVAESGDGRYGGYGDS